MQAQMKHPMPVRLGLASRVKRRIAATLLETTFVLLVIIAIIVGALALAVTTLQQSQVTQEVQVLTNLSGAITRVKSTNGFGTGPQMLTALNDMKLIPANVAKTGTGATTAIRNGWGGAITLAPTDAGGNFSITYAQIPRADCAQLVLALKPGILQSVGTGTTATGLIEAVTTTSANTMCAAAVNTITWDSALR